MELRPPNVSGVTWHEVEGHDALLQQRSYPKISHHAMQILVTKAKKLREKYYVMLAKAKTWSKYWLCFSIKLLKLYSKTYMGKTDKKTWYEGVKKHDGAVRNINKLYLTYHHYIDNSQNLYS